MFQKLTPQQIKTAYAEARRKQQAGLHAAALQDYVTIVRAAPRLAEAHFQMGRVLIDLYRPKSAVSCFQRADQIKPDVPDILRLLAKAQEEMGAQDAAVQTLDRLIAVAPKEIRARADRAVLLQQLGKFDQAERQLRSLAKKAPNEGELYRILVQPIKLAANDPLIAQMKRVYQTSKLPDTARMHLAFALAKVASDHGDDTAVFQYLETANGLQSKAFPADTAATERAADALIAAQSGLTAPPVAAPLPEGPSPIFVTGMPRSGTTLIERILGRHPSVVKAGEVGLASTLARGVLQSAGMTPGALAAADPTMLAQIAKRLRIALAEYAGAETGFVTDKSIGTYLTMPALALALPDARFVAVRRDPRDIALSIYRNYFAQGTYRYASDLAGIAHQITLFERTIAAFRDQMGERLIEVSYDALVADPDGETRRLVAGVGLDWDDACLHPEEDNSAVRTLSLGQVRAPVYASSRGGWRRFADQMYPFVTTYEALSDVPFRD